MKLVKPALNSSAGLPSSPKSANAPTASGRVHDSRSRPPMRAASVAGHPGEGDEAEGEARSRSTARTATAAPGGRAAATRGCAASSAIDQAVECSEGYHWFQATEPSIVGHVVLADSYVLAKVVKCAWLSQPLKNRPLTISVVERPM